MTNRMALKLNFAKKVALAVVGMAALAAPVVIGMVHAPAPGTGQNNCLAVFGGGSGPNRTVEARGTSLDAFAKLLSLAFDRPVIDMTGITGLFDFHLEFAPDETTLRPSPGADPSLLPAAPSDDPGGASIFSAIRQFGVKLDPAKGPREFLVIDRVERPSAN
jgi:uncharacterized protein (TIGR03435 family)